MKKMHIKTGDTVVVLSGADKKTRDEKGNLVLRTGKVTGVSPEEGKVMVEGVHVVKKHMKARKQGDTSSILRVEGAFYASKVQLVCTNAKCEKYNKPIRAKVAFKEGKDGAQVKIRVCPKCGKEI